MEKIFELKQQRAELVTQMRAMMDKYADTEMQGDDRDAYARMEADFDALNRRIETEERQLERERTIGEQQQASKQRSGEPTDRMRAFRDHLRAGTAETLRAYNALSASEPEQAGYLVAPEQFVAEVIKGIDDAVIIRNLAKRYTLAGALSMGFPKRVARMTSAAWGTETAEPTADTTLEFDKREFKPQYLSAEIAVSKPLLANAPYADAIVREEILHDVSRLMEKAYMTGSGSGQPLGVFTASENGIPVSRDVSAGNTATEITFEGLIEAKYAVKPQYHNALRWIFHRDAIKMLAKIKDTEGQYIWQPSVAEGAPDSLIGVPAMMSEYAPNTFTANSYVGIIGDFSQYWIVDSSAMEIQVLNELYARTNQIGYIVRMATDGMPVLEEAFARVKLGA